MVTWHYLLKVFRRVRRRCYWISGTHVPKRRRQNSRVANCHQLLQHLDNGLAQLAQKNMINHKDCMGNTHKSRLLQSQQLFRKLHIINYTHTVLAHTILIEILIISSAAWLRIHFTEGRRKLQVSMAVSGEFWRLPIQNGCGSTGLRAYLSQYLIFYCYNDPEICYSKSKMYT